MSLAMQAELGLMEHDDAYELALSTIMTIDASWPKNELTGFYYHWTRSDFAGLGECSTIDSGLMVSVI